MEEIKGGGFVLWAEICWAVPNLWTQKRTEAEQEMGWCLIILSPCLGDYSSSLFVTWRTSLYFHYKALSTSGFLKSLSLARHTFREYFFYPDNWEVKLYSYYSFMYFLPQTLSECVLCARHHATLLGTNTLDLFYLKSWRSSYWLPLYQALCSLTDDINDILAPHIIFKWKQKRGG